MTKTIIATQIKRPFLVKAINGIFGLLDCLKINPIKLDEHTLLQKAQKKVGLNDYGDDSFREGLQILLSSLNTEAKLNPMGKIFAQNMIINLLTGRLEIIDALKRHPDILKENIVKPLVIAGLPRTGTTILMGLLGDDPNARFLYSWEAFQICPPRNGKDNRFKTAKQQLEMLEKLVPGFKAIHETAADLPQECLALMAFDFVSVQFDLNFNIPSYRKWYLQKDLAPTMAFHKKCLQLLQYFDKQTNPSATPKHWVLKTPPFVGAMDYILDAYPDAQIIQTHRDPAKVIGSVSSLYYALHSLTTNALTPFQEGKNQVQTWSTLLEKGIESRRKHSDKKDQFIDVYFEEVLDDPIACVKKIYLHFNKTWSSELEQRLIDFMANNSRNKYGKHHYTIDMYGLKQNELNAIFKPYCDYFDIEASDR